MNRRGGALLAVLWLTVILATIAGASMGRARLFIKASQNRIWLTQAEWAREACVQVLRGRWSEVTRDLALHRVDLGEGASCSARLWHPDARVNLNAADSGVVSRLIASDTLAAAILDWIDADDNPRPGGAEREWYFQHGRRLPRNGPLVDLRELSLIRGVDSATLARLERLLTLDGSGKVDLNWAPGAVLAALPGLGLDAVAAIERLRARGIPIADLGQVAAELPWAEAAALLGHSHLLAPILATESFELEVEVSGVAGVPPVRSTVRLSTITIDGRPAIRTRRSE